MKAHENGTMIESVKINRKSIKSLRIYLGHDKDECYNKNWTSKLEKLSRILSVCKKKNPKTKSKSTLIQNILKMF